MLGTLVWILAGTVLVALGLFDMLVTVLHPEVESPLSTRFQQLTWRLLMTLARQARTPARADRLLTWGVPLMIAGLITLWLILPITGFALIYTPWLGNAAYFAAPTPRPGTFVTALYYSGVALATLGYGDIQPLTWPFRLLAIFQALAGAAILSLSIAYVLAVYPALSQKRTIAVALDVEVAGQAGAVPMVRRYLVEQRGGDLTARLRELAMALLALTEAHATHPVLYYAHPRRIQHSFLRILVTTQSLIGLLRYGLSPDRHPAIVRNPQLLLLEQALHYSLRSLSASLHMPAIAHPSRVAEQERLAAEYDQCCRELEQLGFVSAQADRTRPVPMLVQEEEAPTQPDGEAPQARPGAAGTVTDTDQPGVRDPALDLSSASPLEAYVSFRLATDPYIAAYAVASGYGLAEARAEYAPTW